jgi:hypothetical protein
MEILIHGVFNEVEITQTAPNASCVSLQKECPAGGMPPQPGFTIGFLLASKAPLAPTQTMPLASQFRRHGRMLVPSW